VLSVVAATFLVGVGLVSLADALDTSSQPAPMAEAPEQVAGHRVLVVAPGHEESVTGIVGTTNVDLHPEWEPLPALGRPYWVAVGRGADLPRLPEGWTSAPPVETDVFSWVAVMPSEPVRSRERYDFVDSLEHADVRFIDSLGTHHPCTTWRFGRWTCGLEDWLWIGESEQPFREVPQRCIWAHPRVDSQLVIRFADVPVGSRVSGRYGIADSGADMPDGAPVELRVDVDDASRLFTAQNRRGLYSYRLIPEANPGETVDVTFTISADHVGRRHFCFTGGMQDLGSEPSRSRRRFEPGEDVQRPDPALPTPSIRMDGLIDPQRLGPESP